jgi:hypothetical protein
MEAVDGLLERLHLLARSGDHFAFHKRTYTSRRCWTRFDFDEVDADDLCGYAEKLAVVFRDAAAMLNPRAAAEVEGRLWLADEVAAGRVPWPEGPRQSSMVRMRIETFVALEHYAANTRDALARLVAGEIDDWTPRK